MNNKSAISKFIFILVKTSIFTLSLIGYYTRRNDFIILIGGDYRIGIFEGILITIGSFWFVNRYGDAIIEFISGIRYLGKFKNNLKNINFKEPIINNKEKIIKYLKDNNGKYCDDCLSTFTDIKPRQQVNQICNELANDNQIQRNTDKCSNCNKIKLVNKY